MGAGLDTAATGEVAGLSQVVAQLREARERWRRSQLRQEAGGRELPSRDALAAVVAGLRGALFPMRLGPADLRQENEDYYVGHTLAACLPRLLSEVRLELRYHARHGAAESEQRIEPRAQEIVRSLGASLAGIRVLLDSDVLATYQGDPAAHSVDEVLLSYPGIHALIHHRIAHGLYRLGVPILARIIAELAHGETGIDIHPGATIGGGLFIDHGTGVVIGETAVIGRNVKLFQAVTLGARRPELDESGKVRRGLPRHPIIEDDVVIYSGATVLGRVTIGRGASIGGNVWLTRSVPPGARVTQANSREDKLAISAER
jgi:serine O-acetyltransferase